MNTHKHARLTFARRVEMVQEMTRQGLGASEAGARNGVTAATARKWLGRFLARAGPQAPISGNRIKVWQDLRFEYDVHGNVVKRRKGAHEEASLKWNAEHQLQEAVVTRHGVTQTTTYAYDALGRRVSKTDAFGSTYYLWDGDLLIQTQRGAKEALFVYEPDSFVPLATVQDGQTYWYQCDQIGAPLELTDEEGQIAWSAEYKVWGKASVKATGTYGASSSSWSSRSEARPPLEQPFRFQGQQFDEETGLHYNRFRYYDPVVGRFAIQDPIGLWGGVNSFAYAPNPEGWRDPLGLKNTRELRKGMKASGKPCPRGYAAHHLIAEQFENHPVIAEAQRRGIYNINAGSNGVALPTSRAESLATGKPLHSGAHLGSYFSAVQNQLDRITPQLSRLSDAELLGKINGVENKLKGALEKDKLRLQNTDPRPPGTMCTL